MGVVRLVQRVWFVRQPPINAEVASSRGKRPINGSLAVDTPRAEVYKRTRKRLSSGQGLSSGNGLSSGVLGPSRFPGQPTTRSCFATAARTGEGIMIILNVFFVALISAAIVGLLLWSVLTQHRHPGCEDVRFGRRLQISVRLVPFDDPRRLPIPNRSTVAPEI